MNKTAALASAVAFATIMTGCAQTRGAQVQNSKQRNAAVPNESVSNSASLKAAISNTAGKDTAAANQSVNGNQTGNGKPAGSTSSSTNHKNGTIISMQKVSIQGQNPKIQLYKMFYWSEGKKVEAMVSEPKNPGAYQYSLVVSCHGGYVAPQNVQHAKSPETWKHFAQNSSRFITIAPQYRGYAESGGTVHGLLGDTIDTENAIAAADSLKQVDDQYMQVWGTSMGGGVALMIASNPKYVGSLAAVVAMSPFVGWDVVGQYALKHPADKRDNQLLSIADRTYGNFSANDSVYEKRSPDIAKIDAPVLLLQGTADKHVTWQSVQQFYKDMEAQDKSGKLVVINGGRHGLPQHQKQVREAVNQWFKTLS